MATEQSIRLSQQRGVEGDIMNELLSRALAAHGGIDQWNRFEMVHATIVSGGQIWAMKGTPQDAAPRYMKVATKSEWASVAPFGSADQRTDFTPKRVAIQKTDGTVVSERLDPAAHAEGTAIDTIWDVLDRAYFNGYALWTYLTTPFLFALPGFEVDEIEPLREKQRATFAGNGA
jgi:hypothetical protein